MIMSWLDALTYLRTYCLYFVLGAWDESKAELIIKACPIELTV